MWFNSRAMPTWFLQSDERLVLASFLWIFGVIGLSEAIRRALRLPPDVSRKLVHVLVAAWALPTALWFETAWWAALTPAVFVIANAVSYRFRLFELIEEEGTGSPGTIYFPLSFALLIVVLWPFGGRAAMVAGLYAMGFGDAAASVLGRRFGRHPFRTLGGTKSWEGTAVMAGVSFLAILLGTYPLLWRFEVLPAAGAAVAAAGLEAIAGRGLDNLTVPLGAALVYFLLQGGLA